MMAGLLDRLRNTRFAAIRRLGLRVVGVSVGHVPTLRFARTSNQYVAVIASRLYFVTTDGSANLVEFCPAEPFAALSLIRGYRDPGTCRDGGAPLLKPVVAKAGDMVELSARGISREWSLSAQHRAAIQRHQRPASRIVAFRTLSSGPRNRLGGLLLSFAQLRQPVLRPGLDDSHSSSAEGVLNTMNAALLEIELSFYSAVVLGLGVSTGHPLGMIAAQECHSRAWRQERARLRSKAHLATTSPLSGR